MTRRSTVFANRLVFRRSRNRCLRASTMSPCGWGATVYSSTLPRRNRSETAPDSQDSNASWREPRSPCHLHTVPGYLSRCRRHYEDPRFEDSVVLLWCTSADPQHMQLHSKAGDAISGRVAGPVPARLQQRNTRWSSGKLNDRLQSVLNAAARLVYSRRRYDHVTPLLRELYWLEMRQRIVYKLAVLVYRCLDGLAPSRQRTSPTISSA